MFKVCINDIDLHDWKAELVPVYQTVKVKKSESDEKHLKEMFDIVLDDYEGGWTCKKSSYRELQISFKTFNDSILNLTDLDGFLNVKFDRELIYLGEWSFEDLKSESGLISGKLRGTISHLGRIKSEV